MSDRADVPDLQNTEVGQQVSAPFIVFSMERREVKGGREMLILRLRNATGDIRGVVWSEGIPQWEDISEGDAVFVEGRIEEGWPPGEGVPNEIKPQAVQLIEGPHPVRKYLNPVYAGDFDELYARFEALKDEIEDPSYRLFLDRFFETGLPEHDFTHAPAARFYHHNYIHGLLQHTVEVAETALAAADTPTVREHVNRDLVIVGALVHDSGKAGRAGEYEWDGKPIGVSNDALLFGHIITGPMQVMQTMAEHGEELAEAGFTWEDAKHVIHIQVSHHGEPEWGSPTKPHTVEARIVHQADLMSAKVRTMTQMIEEHQVDEHGYVRGSGRGAYRWGILTAPRSGARGPRPEVIDSEDVVVGSIAEKIGERKASADEQREEPDTPATGGRSR